MRVTPRDSWTARRTPLHLLATADLSRLTPEALDQIEARANNFANLGDTSGTPAAIIANVNAHRNAR